MQPIRRIQKAEPADYRLGPRSTFTLGVDLGQSIDPTALCLIERRVFGTGEVEWTRGTREGASNPRRMLAVRRIIKGLELLPLGKSYYDIADHIAARKAQIDGHGKCSVVYDETGARGTGEIIKAQIPAAIGVALTGGDEDNDLGDGHMTTSKAHMVTRLLGAVESMDLEAADGLPEFDGFLRHLVDLRRKVSILGRYSFDARSGAHDDFVTAAGLAYWWASRPIQFVGEVRLIGWQ